MAARQDQVRDALNALDFPASKEAVVAHAESVGADEEVLRSVRALPLADYDNLDEILRSVPLEGGS